ncbi:CGNR zinc finger domain-containing protein [Actinacidiphila acidipaludis]|uniref:CGNR zinc finger domain-containing protein n=1 Tax=Actinacidiphila acidipaludis TaxID=2873382 RepID=UPI0027DEF1B6|nr:ABATE domain-containing protein [Streptomyces acidipaludis]
MPTAERPDRFREGAGRLCLDFIRTLRYRGTPAETEELADPAALADWVRQFGTAAGTEPSVPPLDVAQVREARALREAVYALVAAAMSGDRVGPAARRRLNDAAAAPVPVPRLTPSGTVAMSAESPLAALMSLVARDALDLATSPALLTRVRPCASPTCGALFLDHSRPGTRRWCSMDICGNRAKKAGLRARA